MQLHQGTEAENVYLRIMKLLTTQKTVLFDKLANVGFTRQDFTLEEKELVMGETFVIKYNHHPEFQFRIADYVSKTEKSISMAPGTKVFNEYFNAVNWDDVPPLFDLWVDNLKRETNVKDKWSQVEEQAASANLWGFSDNEMFTAQEYLELKNRVKHIQAGVSHLQLLPGQVELLNQELTRLVDQAQKLGKKDFINLFLGTITSIAVALSLTPATLHEIWGLIREAFKDVLLVLQ